MTASHTIPLSSRGAQRRGDLIRSLALVLLSLGSLTPSCSTPTGRMEAGTRFVVERIVDGDTVKLTRPDGTTETVRIQGIDTPEKHTTPKLIRDAEHAGIEREVVKALGIAATEHAERLLPVGSVVHVVGTQRGKYGRLVGYIEAGGQSGASFDFGGRMIADGYAHAYDGGGRFPHEREDYYEALERQARSTSAGLWGEHAMSVAGHHTGGLASLDG